MNYLLSPIEGDYKFDYVIEGEVITATHGEITETFDLSGYGEGKIEVVETFETNFKHLPIVWAERTNGIMSVELLNFIDSDATHEERYPEWQETTEE